MTFTPDIVVWLLAGAATAAVYLLLLRYSVSALVARKRFGAVIPTALRIALAGTAFFIAARQGAVPLLLLLGGFVIVRMIVVGRVRAG
jgi:hypothetical protein